MSKFSRHRDALPPWRTEDVCPRGLPCCWWTALSCNLVGTVSYEERCLAQGHSLSADGPSSGTDCCFGIKGQPPHFNRERVWRVTLASELPMRSAEIFPWTALKTQLLQLPTLLPSLPGLIPRASRMNLLHANHLLRVSFWGTQHEAPRKQLPLCSFKILKLSLLSNTHTYLHTCITYIKQQSAMKVRTSIHVSAQMSPFQRPFLTSSFCQCTLLYFLTFLTTLYCLCILRVIFLISIRAYENRNL